jgi:hypothetical protein
MATYQVKSSATLGALGRALSYLRGGVGSARRGTGFLPGAAARRQAKVVAQQREVVRRLNQRAAAARKRADVSTQASLLGVEAPAVAKRLNASAARLENRLAALEGNLKSARATEVNLNRMLAGKPPLPPPDASRPRRTATVAALGLGLGALGGAALAPAVLRNPESARG